MNNNKKIRGLIWEYTIRMIIGLCAGIFIMLLLYMGFATVLYENLTSQFLWEYNDSLCRELEKYVNDYNINADNAKALKQWADENDIERIIVERDEQLLLDSAYFGVVKFGAVEVYDSDSGIFRAVNFPDGDAFVNIGAEYERKYYAASLVVSIITGVIVCLLIFSGKTRENVRYIRTLEKEVSYITDGNLDSKITIIGDNELSSLASGLNQMRLTIKDNKQKEADLKAAQGDLVRGMAHDLKTPLTSLVTYMEVLKRKNSAGELTNEDIEKSNQKLFQINSFADELFEFFLATTQKEVEIDVCSPIDDSLGEHMSGFIATLNHFGYKYDDSGVSWKDYNVGVNYDFMLRIFDNILSNIEKYADKEKPVSLSMTYNEKDMKAGIVIENYIGDYEETIKGNRIGLVNIRLMMGQMHGRALHEERKETFKLILWFPMHE